MWGYLLRIHISGSDLVAASHTQPLSQNFTSPKNFYIIFC
nr:MAG TPA: hypothetical protein [Caudoviricetes sp.]